MKQPVYYIAGGQEIQPGQKVGANVTWKNKTLSTLAPKFRLDIKRSGWASTWQEGSWTTSPAAAAGGQATVSLESIPIPGDWGEGTTVSVQIVVLGIEGAVWSQADAFTVKVVPDLEIVSVNLYVKG